MTNLKCSALVFSVLIFGNSVYAKRNILFIFTDDQRPNTVRALGNDVIITPTLDSLVHEGTTFTNLYLNGSSVQGVCLASRRQLMTGQSLWSPKNSSTNLLPITFNKGGYDTFRVCKGGNTHGAANSEFDININRDDLRHDVEAPRKYVDDAMKFLKDRAEANDEDPFFLFLGFSNPHDPVLAPQEYYDHYGVSQKADQNADTSRMPPLWPNYEFAHPFDNGHLHVPDENRVIGRNSRTPLNIRNHIGKYYAEMEYIDNQIQRVMDTLRVLGWADSTYVVFTSDQGIAIGSHGLMGKQSLYEHTAKSPLIFTGPGVPKNERRDALVYIHDLYPTMADMAGLQVPNAIDGKSFWSVIKDEKTKIRDFALIGYQPEPWHVDNQWAYQRGIRDERYKLCEYFVGDTRNTQLFDLWADPWELSNLVDSENYKDIVARLRGELGRWKTEYGDNGRFWPSYLAENPTPTGEFAYVDYEGKGCMDEAYEEYNSSYIYEPPGSCVTKKGTSAVKSTKSIQFNKDDKQAYDAKGRLNPKKTSKKFLFVK